MNDVLTELNALLDEDISMWRDLETHRRVRAAVAALVLKDKRIAELEETLRDQHQDASITLRYFELEPKRAREARGSAGD